MTKVGERAELMEQEYTLKIQHVGQPITTGEIELILFESIIEDSDGANVPEVSVEEV